MQAAVLFVARLICRHYALPHPSVEQILTSTGATRSRAYELCASLLALLPTLARPCGRPASSRATHEVAQCKADPTTIPATTTATATATVSDGECIASAVLKYVLQHPGCARTRGKRQGYSDDFRRFILQLRTEYKTISTEEFSRCCGIPHGTLKPWLLNHSDSTLVPSTNSVQHDDKKAQLCVGERTSTLSHIETVLSEWAMWQGSFIDFVSHLQHHLRVPMGRQGIAHILEAHGVRLARKRKGRSPDELALRGAFATFFPGAQWVGDGKAVRVTIGGEPFTFNLQLNVDAHSGAWVGLSVRDTEDSAAVIESFQSGITTTGDAPMAQLLDNKPSNHTPDVDAVLNPAGTLRMRATPKRPQNKAHVEGAFGLFSQNVPPLELDTEQSKHSIARTLLLLVSMTFARAINHRPRNDRGGRSRFELYADKPNDEQIQQARRALNERCRKQELARATRQARLRPEVRDLLDASFARLGLLDPERHVRMAIARYPLSAIADGIAIFTGKRNAGTLPEGVDARYLLGIVRNIAARSEGECIADALLQQRLEARDHVLAALVSDRSFVCSLNRSVRDVIVDCVERALGTDRKLDRLFWLGALTSQIHTRATDDNHRTCLFAIAARSINTTYHVPPRERQDALRFLADRLVPLD